jgi:diguanylate cyclase (GGDEF)-like protein
MNLRLKIMLLTSAIIVFSIVGTANLIGRGFYDKLVEQSELRAQAVIEGVALSIRDDLARDRLDRIGRTLMRLRDPSEMGADVIFAVILDGSSHIVGREVMPEYEQLLKNEFITHAGTTDREMKTRVKFNGHDIVLVSIPIKTSLGENPGVRWGTVVGGMDIQKIRQAIFPVIRRATLLALAFLALSILLMITLLSRSLLNPINQLSLAAARFASGDLKWRAPANPNDEFGRLGATMNKMAGDIEEHTRTLEEAVRARTSELEQANSRLHELAAMDELTGLGNRRTFTAALKREFRRSRRDGSRISLLMLDVDHFKNYNDTQGHPAGDIALNRVGAILRNRLRVTDIPCRYGGEEFATILIATDKDAAREIAESIRATVQAEPFHGEESQPLGTFTVSIGVSTFPDDADDPDRLVDAADIALYQAKEDGRNRIRVFEPSMAAKFNPTLCGS